MAPWSFDVKFPRGTQFTFGSLTFVAGEDGDLKMLPPGTAPEHPAPVPSSTSGGTCSGSDPFTGLYIRTAKLVRGIPIVTSILRLSSEYRVRLHRHRPSIKIYLVTIPRSRPAPAKTLQRAAASFLWWPQMGIRPATAPVDIPLLEDQRRPMPKPLARGWFRI
jgi:hypothetical protein